MEFTLPDIQTQIRGTNEQEYEIYTSLTHEYPIKSYEEWLDS